MLSIITFTDADVSSTVAWASMLVGDLMPLLVLIFGIAVGGFVISVILKLRG
ncbi:unnamed protein product [marine sediment metagenome]|uniref:Uncharacterized protein n=1 Tax=marine sediment metagenome TaxID=412755 RepID=X1JJF6_9ZZZZ